MKGEGQRDTQTNREGRRRGREKHEQYTPDVAVGRRKKIHYREERRFRGTVYKVM